MVRCLRLILLGLIPLLASACGQAARGSGSSTGPISVVAAENFYGDILTQIGGPYVDVTSILSDPEADPHLFEPGTANGAAVAQARLVVESGLGYDAFMDRLLDASPDPSRQVVTVATALGMTGTDLNPHIWYDVPRLPDIAKAIGEGLDAADPAHSGYYDSHEASFITSLRPLDDAVAALKAADQGVPVAYTEPVPGYLLAAAGLNVLTPEAFSRSIEEGTDPTPQAVAQMEALFTDGKVKALLYNSQATSPITEQIQTLAQQHGIPIVPVTETLPPGMSFQDWQLQQVQALAQALGG